MTFLRTLSKNVLPVDNEHNVNFVDDLVKNDCIFEELDCCISKTEIVEALDRAKMNKSPGVDNVLNEYFL